MTWRNYQRRECWHRGRLVRLCPQERVIVSTLLLHRGCPVSREDLIEEIYPNPHFEPDWSHNVIPVLIYRLRRKLPGLISIWARKSGLGYFIETPGRTQQLAA